jgi:hypothetical protein
MIEPVFSESAQEHMRGLIRLTVEFYAFLQVGNPGLREIVERTVPRSAGNPLVCLEECERQYSIESIFSGIDAFCSVNAAYKVLVGAMNSAIEWNEVSALGMKTQFVALFEKFVAEAHFEVKCRMLLDLFKLQIVYAGMFYE